MEILDLTQNNFADLLKRPRLETPELTARVAQIIGEVIERGDKALVDFAAEFDAVKIKSSELRLSEEAIKKGAAAVNEKVMSALRLAAERIRAYHERQKRGSWSFEIGGATLGQKVSPLRRVGVYVPGGRANYPSSVLMNVVPARVAGVKEIALCCPTDESGQISPYVLAAADLLEITEIYRVGGAQAIAALAYGTESLAKVDKITGPGNIYVTLAKKLVTGDVGIDMLAGPSEIVIIADEQANPVYIAADILAQAEHDPLATSILITTSRQIALDTAGAIEDQLEHLTRRDIAAASLQANGKALVTDDMSLAVDFVNAIAPEHLEIMTADPEVLADRIENAGAIFLGDYTPEALGDYIAGSNHILPTSGTARFCSPLGVDDFMKRTSILAFTKEAALELAEAGETISLVEGLGAHAKSFEVRKRTND